MQYDLSVFNLVILVVVSVLLTTKCITDKRLSELKKVYFLLALIGIVVYSGISTLYIESSRVYFWPFMFFLLCFYFGFIIGNRIKVGIRTNSINETYIKQNTKNKTEVIPTKLLIIFTFLFFSYYFIQLVYPVIRISDLFNLNISITGIFEKREATRGNTVYQLFYYINMFTMVFPFIWMYRLRKAKKTMWVVVFFVFWVYIQTVVIGYIGRYKLIILLFIVIALITCHNSKRLQLSKKTILLFGVLILAMIPFLLAYESYRLGNGLIVTSSFRDSFVSLFQSETGYGRFYDQCRELASTKSFLGYWAWLLTLPLPSAIFSFKNSIPLVNVYFSEHILGVAYGLKGYYVVLPSILGEAYIVYGQYLYWIHAIFLGVFLSKFSSLMERNEELEIINFYFAVSCLALGRGGTGSVLPPMINCMVFYILAMIIIRRKITIRIRE